MSVDVSKMPKLGFGLMRLPEKEGEIDLSRVYESVCPQHLSIIALLKEASEKLDQ